MPTNIPIHNQFIPEEHLQSKKYLEILDNWSQNNTLELNIDKTKAREQFTINLRIINKDISIVEKVKLLGTHITSDLKWERNTHEIVKRAYARMEILRKLVDFKPKI